MLTREPFIPLLEAEDLLNIDVETLCAEERLLSLAHRCRSGAVHPIIAAVERKYSSPRPPSSWRGIVITQVSQVAHRSRLVTQ